MVGSQKTLKMKKEIIIERIRKDKLYLIVDDKSMLLEKESNFVYNRDGKNDEILLYLFNSRDVYTKKLEALYGHKITGGQWPSFDNPKTPILEWLVKEIHEFNKQFNKTSQILLLLL